MKIGTKSILFGAHAFWLHPWFVALAWWKLYRFRTVEDPHVGPVNLWNWRLWLAFVVHDMGYWGLPNMDGPEGERHPLWGARVVADVVYRRRTRRDNPMYAPNREALQERGRWHSFTCYHSRFLAKQDGKPYSLLCVADKFAVALEPWWLYLPRVWASGELWEYMALAGGKNGSKYKGEPNSKYESLALDTGSVRSWHRAMTSYLRRWALAHKDGCEDTWTPTPTKESACTKE